MSLAWPRQRFERRARIRSRNDFPCMLRGSTSADASYAMLGGVQNLGSEGTLKSEARNVAGLKLSHTTARTASAFLTFVACFNTAPIDDVGQTRPTEASPTELIRSTILSRQQAPSTPVRASRRASSASQEGSSQSCLLRM